MGLVLSVGPPEVTFIDTFVPSVRGALQERFGLATPGGEAYYTEELPWSGWAALQEHALAVLPEASISHLLAIEAWQGVYLPLLIEPGEMVIGESPTPLRYASLPRLTSELHIVAATLNLPTEEALLRDLWERLVDDGDRDWDIQTCCQLMLAATYATSGGQPLWVVK